jgi:hypothetical protein
MNWHYHADLGITFLVNGCLLQGCFDIAGTKSGSAGHRNASDPTGAE